jgi:hypothetical protein
MRILHGMEIRVLGTLRGDSYVVPLSYYKIVSILEREVATIFLSFFGYLILIRLKYVL